MPSVTPRPQAQAMLSWLPIPPAETWATTPTPNNIRIIVPANSADISPTSPRALSRSTITSPRLAVAWPGRGPRGPHPALRNVTPLTNGRDGKAAETPRQRTPVDIVEL